LIQLKLIWLPRSSREWDESMRWSFGNVVQCESFRIESLSNKFQLNPKMNFSRSPGRIGMVATIWRKWWA